MEKAEVYAALGLEVPAEQPEVAGPAAADNTGVKEQPVTGAAAQDGVAVDGGAIRGSLPTETDEGADGGQASGSRIPSSGAGAPPSPQGEGTSSVSSADTFPRGEGFGSEKAEMSKEERAEQARMRRQREKDAAVQEALAQQKAEFDRQLKEIFETTGMTNRYRNGSRITTKEEFDQWRKDAEARRFSEKLKTGALSADDLQAAIEATPAMQKLQQLQQSMEAQQQAAQREAFQKTVDREMETIRTQFDPTIRNLTDILDRPEGAEFARLVNEEGRDFVSAYKEAFFDSIVKARQQAAQIGAARSAHSKDHLVAYGQNAGEGVRVPRQTMELYRSLRPDLSEDQIRRDYARRQSRGGN